ncbi:MAG: ion transporter [Actinomycetota bacterium]|nr:ion transporter [Actinomycetota bacterium]
MPFKVSADLADTVIMSLPTKSVGQRARSVVAELRNDGITEEEKTLLKIVRRVVVIAALATIPVTIAELNESSSTLVRVADWLIWLAFLVEWALMLLFPPKAGGFLGRNVLDRHNWRDWRNWLSVAILIISFPLLYPAFQLIRLVRVVRLARLGRVAAVTTRALGDTLGRRGVMYVAALACSAIVLGGVLMSSVEPKVVGGKDIWNGIWWAATTTIGAGVGGLGPRSAEGRTITIILMLCGVAFVTTLAGSIAAFFLGQRSSAGSDGLHRQVAEIHEALIGSQEEGPHRTVGVGGMNVCNVCGEVHVPDNPIRPEDYAAHGLLTASLSHSPAYIEAEVEVELLSDEEFNSIITREQAEADARAAHPKET